MHNNAHLSNSRLFAILSMADVQIAPQEEDSFIRDLRQGPSKDTSKTTGFQMHPTDVFGTREGKFSHLRWYDQHRAQLVNGSRGLEKRICFTHIMSEKLGFGWALKKPLLKLHLGPSGGQQSWLPTLCKQPNLSRVQWKTLGFPQKSSLKLQPNSNRVVSPQGPRSKEPIGS